MKNLSTKLLAIALITMTGFCAQAQNISLPRVSQEATVSQRLGLSDVTISYHSPSVKKRKVFGGIVRYDNIWRAGANENTTIHLTHDATVEGQKIAAGTYGLYMIPGENDFKVLFSKFSQSWGSNSPNEEDLVLNVSVKPQTIPFKEWLNYEFIDRSANSVTVALRWETLSIPFNISFDINQVVIDNARAELKGVAGFGWRGHMQAARFCVQNNMNLEEAMVWIDKSIASSKGFSNLAVKATILAKNGDVAGAEKVMEEAVPTGNPNQINAYGYQLLGLGKTKKAIEIFTFNVENNQDNPFIWGLTDSLAEAYLKDGDKAKALKYYKIAKKKAPQNQHAYLDGVIAGIK